MYDIPMSRSPAAGGVDPLPAGAALGRRPLGARLVWTVARLAAALGAAVGRELRIRRATRDLAMMDEHMLRDIGITRAEIGHAIRYGRRR